MDISISTEIISENIQNPKEEQEFVVDGSPEKEFNFGNYLEFLDNSIEKIMSRQVKETFTFDILETEKSREHKLLILKEKQNQMKIGEIWQEVLGTYDGFINLKVGHESGLDILSHTKKIAIELKNRTNTDNASSKKSNFEKLANFKMSHPDYTCIYANINDSTEEKTMSGSIKKIICNGVEIEHHIGYKFLKFILGDEVDIVIEFVKMSLDRYR